MSRMNKVLGVIFFFVAVFTISGCDNNDNEPGKALPVLESQLRKIKVLLLQVQILKFRLLQRMKMGR